MFTWLTRVKGKPAAAWGRRTRLSLEALEERYCLTGPAITALSATVQPGHLLQVSGTVTDPTPASVNLSFSGAATGTTTADSYGHFNWTTTAAVLGTLSAVGVDGQGLSSNTATASVSKAAPTITLKVSRGTGRQVTLCGSVTDLDPGSRRVSFSGVVSASVSTAADGSFSLVTQASGLGNVQASTTDLWGQSSNTAQATVSCNAPTISDFKGIEEPLEYWAFSATVQADWLSGLDVALGGIPSLKDKHVTTNADGSFTLTVQLQLGEQGTATAQATDIWGQTSSLAMCIVRQT